MQNLILQNAIWYVFCDIIIDNKLYVIMDIFVYLTLCFTSLFTLMDPLGVMPVFLQMTDGMDTKERRYIALKACTIAFIILDRKSTRLNSSHRSQSRMPSSA